MEMKRSATDAGGRRRGLGRGSRELDSEKRGPLRTSPTLDHWDFGEMGRVVDNVAGGKGLMERCGSRALEKASLRVCPWPDFENMGCVRFPVLYPFALGVKTEVVCV